MIYQLPNGKIVNLSIEEYLDLTDEDIQYLMSENAGNYANSPWHGSAIKKHRDKDNTEEDTSIDYSPELEEPLYHTESTEEVQEDFPDFPEDMCGI